MTIKFYKITDDHRQLTKTLTAGNLKKTLTGSLKSDTDILNPVIEVAYDSDIITCNYMEIADLGRYYFINNIKTSAQRLFIDAHVDVLQSYATQIKELKCVIARQEADNRTNKYLNDGMWKNLQPKDVLTARFPNPFYKQGSYVLVVGGDS